VLLVELGRWPVIDKKWSARKFILEDVLGDMRGKYNAPILLDVWIGPDDKNSSINIMQVYYYILKVKMMTEFIMILFHGKILFTSKFLIYIRCVLDIVCLFAICHLFLVWLVNYNVF
jgi:membrane metallo-endopeptidase-like protein 1